MLHENVLMVDIDLEHWRHLQELFLESAKSKRRIIVIHENGRLLKLVHSQRTHVERPLQDRVDDANAFAKALYEANQGTVDFVAVFERGAFDDYFAEVQSLWDPDEDLDAFVHRTYALLDGYPDGMVTYPGSARSTLGLQWRVGGTYEEVTGAVEAYVEPETTVLLTVFDGDELWATLVLRFDRDRRIDLVTSVDPADLQEGNRDEIVQGALDWVEERYPTCSLGLFFDRGGVEEFKASKDKVATLRQLARAGRLTVRPAPDALANALA